MSDKITRDMIFGRKKSESIEVTSNKNIKNEISKKEIELDKLVDFRRSQPFSLYSKEKMEEMKQSISRNGLFVPITVRLIENDKYEILAGHNRVRCCRELGYDNIPANIVECDDDRATLIMLETNLYQRDNIPLTEKGEAYKQRLEILLRQEKNGDLLGHERKVEYLAEISADSKTQIQRLIRLTYLIKKLKEKVNNNQIAFYVAVELSYIDEIEQEKINSILDSNKPNISIKQAEKLRELKGTLNEESIKNILVDKNIKEVKFKGKLDKSNLKKYKSKFNSDIEFNEIISKLLEEYFKK
jgi:ParB family chromosome partitioning protein